MEYNEADQLVEWPGEHVYGYDSAGNLTYEYDSSGQTLQKTYAYSPAGLLSSVVHAGIGTSYMAWDADGNRVSFTSSSTSATTEFVYDPTAGIPAVIEEVTPSGSIYYVREPDGELIARVSESDARYYHFDALGSTRLLTDASGAETDTYAYDAWGQLLYHTGDTQQPYQYVGRLGYYTHYQDENLPVVQLGVRVCDTSMGRFTQIDAGEADERYAVYLYGQDVPTRYVDPSGLDITIRPPNCPFPCGSGIPGQMGNSKWPLPTGDPMQPGNPPDDVWKCTWDRNRKCNRHPDLCPKDNCWVQRMNGQPKSERQCRCEDVFSCWKRRKNKLGSMSAAEEKRHGDWVDYCTYDPNACAGMQRQWYYHRGWY